MDTTRQVMVTVKQFVEAFEAGCADYTDARPADVYRRLVHVADKLSNVATYAYDGTPPAEFLADLAAALWAAADRLKQENQ